MSNTTLLPSGTAEESPFLTVQQTADQLGYSHMTIRRRIDAGELPAIKIGSKAVVPRVFVDALVAAVMSGRTVDVDVFTAEWSARQNQEVA